MPQQLPQITIFRTRHPDPWEAIFQHQFQQKPSVLAVGFLLPYAFGLYLGWISNSQLEPEFG